MGLRNNIVANYLGQGWRGLIGLIFIPYYIKFLGVEAYGLIGVFAILQAWFTVLDFGMRPTLSREMARFSAGIRDLEPIRDLLRSVELIAISMGVLVAIGVWSSSHWLASNWLHAESLPVQEVARAFTIMGIVLVLRFIEGVYASCIVGLQRQVLDNILSSGVATARGLGAVGVMYWISPTIDAFFTWQAIVSLISLALYAGAVYRLLPPASRPSRFSSEALLSIWRFASGMIGITFLALLLTQIDKVLLSRLLPLQTFGYYSLASVLASVLSMFATPVASAFYPRFTELAARGNEPSLLANAYHRGAQLVTVLMGSPAIILILFADRIVLLWTGDPILTQQVAPVLRLLAVGTLFNGFMVIPHEMQLAHGWTSLSIKVNCVAVAILVPTIFTIVPLYGMVGAAWVWVALNSGYLIFDVYFMHQRLLRHEKFKWYRNDIGIPMLAAATLGGICRGLLPPGESKLSAFFFVGFALILVLSASTLASRILREQVLLRLPGLIKLKY